VIGPYCGCTNDANTHRRYTGVATSNGPIREQFTKPES